MTIPTLVVKAGREESLLRRHPWLFEGAVERVKGNPDSGDTVILRQKDGPFLGWASFSPHSQIRARVWSFRESDVIDQAWFHDRIQQAIALRDPALLEDSDAAFRLINAESDGLPGVVVDRYPGFLVCQFLSAGAERHRESLVHALATLFAGFSIYERSDESVREKEGLPPRKGVLRGQEPPALLPIREGGLTLLVDLVHGHKTGFYLDQRENRALVRQAAAGREVLNAFAYSGAFGLAALAGGARRVVQLEASGGALKLADTNREANGFGEESVEALEGDVFTVLRRFRDQARQFDLIILDPPKFAESRVQVERAARGYKDINLLACKLLRPGGDLFTFSCSGLVSPDLFQKIVADAALDANREARILRWLRQAPDHPVALPFPEGAYLKGLWCRVGR